MDHKRATSTREKSSPSKPRLTVAFSAVMTTLRAREADEFSECVLTC
jgi:hypothetical protein